MELRPELMPPALDEAKVLRLTELAAGLDGAHPGMWEEDLAEFNRIAGTTLPIDGGKLAGTPAFIVTGAGTTPPGQAEKGAAACRAWRRSSTLLVSSPFPASRDRT